MGIMASVKVYMTYGSLITRFHNLPGYCLEFTNNLLKKLLSEYVAIEKLFFIWDVPCLWIICSITS
jgi:hypothetical protein